MPKGAGVYAHTLEVYGKEYSDKALARARACMGERAVRLAAVEAGVAEDVCAVSGWASRWPWGAAAGR